MILYILLFTICFLCLLRSHVPNENEECLKLLCLICNSLIFDQKCPIHETRFVLISIMYCSTKAVVLLMLFYRGYVACIVYFANVEIGLRCTVYCGEVL